VRVQLSDGFGGLKLYVGTGSVVSQKFVDSVNPLCCILSNLSNGESYAAWAKHGAVDSVGRCPYAA
jgi:hypothetical protein